VNEFLLTIPFFTAGTGWSADVDDLTKTTESTALFSVETSNSSGCCGTDDFSDSRIIVGAALSAGAFCRTTACGDDFSSTLGC
jgi:hypothetical protein